MISTGLSDFLDPGTQLTSRFQGLIESNGIFSLS